MSQKVRVRFAPSPTGGLHLGGVRTLLYNYLFARHHGGELILRIEDTDQSRYVEGAEDYIYRTMEWCGLNADESPRKGGPYGPYRQSERKSIYGQYAQQLLDRGLAYYAFDTPEELEKMRTTYKTPENPSPQYDHRMRGHMRNSLNLTRAQTRELLDRATPHVIRIRMPEDEMVEFTDMIRGKVQFQTGGVDDKVLIKADGMPTYHLAVVVDDFLMKITHAFRGEEWLPSAPVHILLWRYLFGADRMPQWAHFPLILKPDGNGKLSKRDSDRLGIPIFPMDWTDPRTGEKTQGFWEKGFLPEAFVNMLALLGWNPGSEQEILSMEEMVQLFAMDRVHKHGARFDFEKAKWFNQEWIRKIPPERLQKEVANVFGRREISVEENPQLEKIINLVKERCVVLEDFYTQASFFFTPPQTWDLPAVQAKWSDAKFSFFEKFQDLASGLHPWEAPAIESAFKELAASLSLKVGELQLPLRIMLVGGKMGPPVFEIAQVIGRPETVARVHRFLKEIQEGPGPATGE